MSTFSSALHDVLSYDAPYLTEKLLKEHIVESLEEGEALFREVKRFIVLVRSDDTTLWDMHSLRIDEVWHQFVLFTAEYIAFGQRFFGTYIQHSPSNAPIADATGAPRVSSTFEDFKARYTVLFGEELPDLWYDEKQVTPNRRILNDNVGTISLLDADGMSHLCDDAGEVLISVNRFAHIPLKFICNTPTFYVRELPGDLDDDEKVALVSTMMEFNLLRIAS